MGQNFPAVQNGFTLKVLSGPDKGATYKLMSSTVRLGRGEDNDISLAHDPKCSRHHAVINMTANGVEVLNVSERNALFVNGQEVKSARLNPETIIQIGDSKFQFNFLRPSKAISKNRQKQMFGSASSSGKRRRSSSSGSKGPFYIIVGVLVLLVAVLFMDTGKKKEEVKIRTEEDILTQIEENRKISEQVGQVRKDSGRDSQQYREAQAAFIKGFRDFQKGQYERATGHFQTCMAIYPKHPRCSQYFTEAKTKFSELVQYYLRLGYEYQSKNQFRQCMNAFNNVRIMQKDRSSNIFKEADAGYQACLARNRERL